MDWGSAGAGAGAVGAAEAVEAAGAAGAAGSGAKFGVEADISHGLFSWAREVAGSGDAVAPSGFGVGVGAEMSQGLVSLGCGGGVGSLGRLDGGT